MVEARTHLIVTEDPDSGFSAESPQVPGFIFGRNTMTEFLADYRQALHWAGVRGDVMGHRQSWLETPEGADCCIRHSTDGETAAARLEVAQRVERIMQSEQRFDFLDRAARNLMGELTFVAVLPSDPIRFVTEQMDERGDVAAGSPRRIESVADRERRVAQMRSTDAAGSTDN